MDTFFVSVCPALILGIFVHYVPFLPPARVFSSCMWYMYATALSKLQ